MHQFAHQANTESVWRKTYNSATRDTMSRYRISAWSERQRAIWLGQVETVVTDMTGMQ